MSEPETGGRRRFYLLHKWLGLVAATLGVLVFFSGSIAIFHHEIDAWASRGHRYLGVQEVREFDFDRAYAVAAQGVDPKYAKQVDVFQADGHPLAFFFHVHEQEGTAIEEFGTFVELDPRSLAVVRRETGSRSDVMRPTLPHALGSFFLDLHLYLLMPETLGLFLTGIVGFALSMLVATGALVHRPNREKLLRWPRLARPRQLLGDLHTLLGGWTLPFTILLAITGAFFSFAASFLIPVVALVAFNGNQEALIRTVIGRVEVAPSEEVASLNPIVQDALSRRPDTRFESIGLDKWGEHDANATVRLVESSLLGERPYTLVYDGHTGAFLLEKPPIGTRPSFGGALVDLVAHLHFGTLLGPFTKVLWGLLGLFTCALAATGLTVHLARRHDSEGFGVTMARLLAGATAGGLPLATGVAVLTWVALAGLDVSIDAKPILGAVFLFTIGATGALAIRESVSRVVAFAWASAGVLLVCVPAVVPLASGVTPFVAWSDPVLRASVAVDLACLVLGAALLAAAQRMTRFVVSRWPSPSTASRDPSAASLG